ncbi:MAG: hypothetical protein QNJ92_08095 [Alphaproteobacteria bacterium]|nr:hypothetical protein [Alphaproteobacteria bacterium]
MTGLACSLLLGLSVTSAATAGSRDISLGLSLMITKPRIQLNFNGPCAISEGCTVRAGRHMTITLTPEEDHLVLSLDDEKDRFVFEDNQTSLILPRDFRNDSFPIWRRTDLEDEPDPAPSGQLSLLLDRPKRPAEENEPQKL